MGPSAALLSLLLALALLLAGCAGAAAARILALAPFNSRSHWAALGRLLRALAARGHRLDVLSHFPAPNPPPNYRDLSVNGSFASWDDSIDAEAMVGSNPLQTAYVMWVENLEVCAAVFEQPVVKNLIASDARYDLVISEIFASDCLVGLAHRFRAPLLGVVAGAPPPWALDRVGNPEHPAYVPGYFVPYTERMQFGQRLYNALLGWAARRLHHLVCGRATDALARRYLGEHLPPVDELVRNTSLVLVNTHFSLSFPRPLMPNVVEVGGLHIDGPKPLPEDLRRFLDGAEEGAVLLSLGATVRLASFAPDRLSALLGALGALPQRVLVRSSEPLPGLPANARRLDWLPQLDVLCHPRVRLLVWHGGLLAAQEAVWAAVPGLAVPLFADQHLHAAALQARGVALALEYGELTRDRLDEALARLLHDPGFSERARALSLRFRDRPQAALDAAVWWTEYVLRHRGAPHLRSAAADLPLTQLLLLDAAAALAAVAALFGAAVWLTLGAVYRVAGWGTRSRPGPGPRRADLAPAIPGQRVKRYTKTKHHYH